MDKSKIDLLGLIGMDTELKKHGKEYKGACPFCGGVDRFWLQPDYGNGGRWSCRQCSLSSGDCVSYVMRRDNCDFMMAVSTLELTPDESNYRQRKTITPPENVPQDISYDVGCMNAEYQYKAGEFIRWSRNNLWGAVGVDALVYLKTRGFNERVLKSAQVGYNPNYYKRQWGNTEVHLFPGVVLPTINYRTWQITRIKIRFDNPRHDKYGQVAGSANELYIPFRSHQIEPGCNVVLVESEIDALSLPPGMCVPVAVCGNTASRGLNGVMALQRAKTVVLAFDDDKAGDAAGAWWGNQLSNSVRLIPTRHDVSEMREHGDFINEWLMGVIV